MGLQNKSCSRKKYGRLVDNRNGFLDHLPIKMPLAVSLVVYLCLELTIALLVSHTCTKKVNINSHIIGGTSKHEHSQGFLGFRLLFFGAIFSKFL